MERFPTLLRLDNEYTFEFSQDDFEYILNEIAKGNSLVRAIANNCIRLLETMLSGDERSLLRSWERVIAYFGDEFPTGTLSQLHDAIVCEDLQKIDRLSHRDI